MDETTRGYCPSCGKPAKEGASFCTGCGAAIGATGGPREASPVGGGMGVVAEDAAGGAETQAPPAGDTPQPPGPPPYAAPAATGYMAEAAAEGMAPKKSKVPLVMGIVGGILVAGGIAVLVLWLTLWRGGAEGAGDPLALAEKYISALDKGDAQAYMDCFEPEYFTMDDNPILEGMGMDMKKMIEMTIEMSEVSFQGVELEKRSESGARAEVVTTAGMMSVSVMGFERELDLADEPLEFVMEKKGGRWYLTKDPMPGSMEPGESFEELEDMGMEDLQDLLPEDLNLEDLEQILPEDLDLGDLENMSRDELMRLLEELERMLEEMPSEGGAGT